MKTTHQFPLGLTLAASLAALSGCAGHGAFTSKAIEEGAMKMSAVKSGVEWQQAHEQFLAGELMKASRSIENAIALNPTVAKSHVLRGRIMIERGELESARASLLRAEELDAENVESQYYLGIVHERFSQTEEAAKRYRNAAKLDPSSAQYVVAAAEMLVQLNRLDEAEALLNTPHESLTHNAAIRQTAGHVALLRHKPAEAVELLKQARLLAPDDASVLEDLVRAQMAAKGYADAEFNISVLLRDKKNQERRDLLHWQAECFAALNRLTDARGVLERLVRDDAGRSDVTAWIALGNVAAALRDQARLREAALRITSLAPERPDGYVMRAIYLRQTGELASALKAIDTALSLDEEAPTARLLRGLILQELGRTDEASDEISSLVDQHPHLAAARQLLDLIHVETRIVLAE
ncbi:MAG: tetratricopeptide repeat protein [Phycisphaerales bacterium]